MKLLRRWVLAAVLLAAPVAAIGQAPESQSQAIPPETLAPNAEAAALFEALRTRPATVDFLAGFSPEQTAPMDEIIAQRFVRGETVEHWQDGGVDLRALVAARPGGPGDHMIEGTSLFGPFRVYLRDEAIEPLLPASWFLVGQYGEPVDGGTIQIEIARISPKIIYVERLSYERVGNALCRERGQTRLYADPSVAASEMDMIALVMSLRMLPALDRQNLCALFEEPEPGRYAVRFFDRSGRRIPRMDEEGQMYRIVPRAPFPVTAETPGTPREAAR